MTVAVAGLRSPARSRLQRMMVLLTGSTSEEYDAEYGQAVTRFFNGPLAAAYVGVILLIVRDAGSRARMLTLLEAAACYILISWALLYWIVRRPGYNLLRRGVAMVLDYGAMGSHWRSDMSTRFRFGPWCFG